MLVSRPCPPHFAFCLRSVTMSSIHSSTHSLAQHYSLYTGPAWPGPQPSRSRHTHTHRRYTSTPDRYPPRTPHPLRTPLRCANTSHTHIRHPSAPSHPRSAAQPSPLSFPVWTYWQCAHCSLPHNFTSTSAVRPLGRLLCPSCHSSARI